ncbi:fumarylacetoacetate hydrolase family protein [Catellatospora vulcania]|uniref:fumarylacetoacetate hydrolase family protein n=1 Tax=Catellatospora vulcania TaxID=1460450 RepID=UPI0012D3B95B|nr:fumarylacetoacetate hydrolase family protein [Catellatospora vulcania]
MRFMRVGPAGRERPALLDRDGTAYDLSSVTSDVDGGFLDGGGVDRAARALAVGDLPVLDLAGQRIGAPVARPGKIVCVGPNFRKPGLQTWPDEPALFLKAANTVVGPDDEVLLPRGGTAVDWEVELAVVIGATARYLDSPADAKAVIGGYAISHDVSERVFQHERGGTWDKGKCCETFNPLGPWLVTPDTVGDVNDLGMRLWVDGLLRQNGTTADMIFDVAYLVWHVSQFMVLEPGDVINTGTPPGCAIGLPDRPYLRAGQIVEVEIDGLGRQRQRVGQA